MTDAKALLRDTLNILQTEIKHLKDASATGPLTGDDPAKLCAYARVLSAAAGKDIGSPEDALGDFRAMSMSELQAVMREALGDSLN
jgi:hypothetical protein